MGCNKKAEIKQVTTERCNEMIDDLERQIKNKFKTVHKYSDKERIKLIAEIKKHPNHIWMVGENSLIHMELA